MNGNLIVTISIFLMIQVIASVWWASKVNTLLNLMQVEMRQVLTELKTIREFYVTKSEYLAREIAVDSKIDKIFEKIDNFERIT